MQRTGLVADWRAESLAWPCAPWAHLLAARAGAVNGVVIARADMFHELQAIATGRDASHRSFAKSFLRSKPQPRKRCPFGAWTEEDVGAGVLPSPGRRGLFGTSSLKLPFYLHSSVPVPQGHIFFFFFFLICIRLIFQV